VSLLVLPVLLSVAVPGTREYLLAASLIAVMVGALNVLLALLRFGALVTLASRSVLIGFAAGAAVHIAVGQVRHLLGIEMAPMPELYRSLAALAAGWEHTHVPTALLGLGTFAGLLVLKRLGGRVPAALLAIAAAGGAVALLGLDEQGVRVVGTIPRSLPPPTWSTTGLWPDSDMIRRLAVGAVAVAALGLVEAVASAQTLARRSGDRLNSNQEFFGQGLANIASGLLSGYACSGSFTRSALAQQSGGRTHLTGVITGLAILASMLVLAPYARYVPRAAIAGVLLVVAWAMVDRDGIRRVLRTSRSEAAIMIVTFVATLALPLDFAVLAGIVFSLAFFVIRSSLPRVHQVVPDPTFRHLIHQPDQPVCPQLAVMNIRGPLFFGAVYHLEEELRHNHERNPGQNHLVLRMHGVDICDFSGVEMLESTIRTYRQLGGDVFLVRLRQPVLETLANSGFIDETLGRDHVLQQDGAIEHIFEHVLDPVVCVYECEHRVFAECQALEKHRYDVQIPTAPRHAHDHAQHVSVSEFQELLERQDAIVLDVREPEEYQQGHLPGSGLLPLRTFPEKGSELPADKTLLLVCRSGRRTSRALFMLEEMGFEDLHGLRGGILAWRAEGLPITGSVPDDVPEDVGEFPLMPASYDLLTRDPTRLRARGKVEQVADELEQLCRTGDLSLVRAMIERSLEAIPGVDDGEAGCVSIAPDIPVLIVSALSGGRAAFHRFLQDHYCPGGGSNLENLVAGRLQVLLLGDILLTDDADRWQTAREEFIARSGVGEDGASGRTPRLDREMQDGLGLAAMVMRLQRAASGIYCLKGRHDNLLNSEEHGNARVARHITDPGEGEMGREWVLARLGPALAGKLVAWQDALPVFAVCDGGGTGPRFAASHNDPAAAYTLEQIRTRSPEVVSGLTGTHAGGVHVPLVLESVFGRGWERARYFAGHMGSLEGVIHVPENHIAFIGKPNHAVVIQLVPGGTETDEVHILPIR